MSTNPPPPKGAFISEAKFDQLLKLAEETSKTADIKVANKNGEKIEQILRTVARGEY